MQFDINYLAVFVSAVVMMVIGALWYSPLLFLKPWMKMMGITDGDMKSMQGKSMGTTYLIAFLGNLVAAYVLAHFLQLGKATTAIDGAAVAFVAWFGFVATVTLSSVLWERKPWKLYFLNNAHVLVTFVVAGAIIGGWIK